MSASGTADATAVQAEAVAKDRLRARLPASVPAGLVWLEAERGPLLGAPRPLLLLPEGCHALAAEVQRMLTGGSRQGVGLALAIKASNYCSIYPRDPLQTPKTDHHAGGDALLVRPFVQALEDVPFTLVQTLHLGLP